jgi:single-strand DNA-binding protein
MANDINSVVLIGRLTRESELKFLANGTAVARFSLAVNRIKGSAEQREEEVSFFEVTLWGKQAETLNPYLTKGRQICLTGELRQSRCEQDGQSRSKIEIVAQSIQLLGGNQSANASAEASTSTDNRTYAEKGKTTPQPRKEPTQADLGMPVSSGVNAGRSGFNPPPRARGPVTVAPENFDDDIPF